MYITFSHPVYLDFDLEGTCPIFSLGISSVAALLFEIPQEGYDLKRASSGVYSNHFSVECYTRFFLVKRDTACCKVVTSYGRTKSASTVE